MIWTIDRIEDGIAVIETPNGNLNVGVKHLPEGVKEGNKIFLRVDEKDEQESKERIKLKMEKLFID